MTTRQRDEYVVADADLAQNWAGRLKPPFGYYGAKQRIAARIVSSLPPHNAWVEAFCGSAAITLSKKPAPIEVINDLDGEIVNFFAQLRNHPKALCRAVALTPYAREEFYRARSQAETRSPLERARQFIVATNFAVNSTVAGFHCGFSFSQSYSRSGREARVSRWYNLPERMAAVVERLRNVRVENRDAREIMEMFLDRPATLIYLDPPYFVKRSQGYAVDAKDETFHRDLLKLCTRSKAMILISGYHTDLYAAVLSKATGWQRSEIKTHTRDTSGQDYPRTEVIWKNPAFLKAERTGKVPIRLTKQEIAQRKVNPPRRG